MTEERPDATDAGRRRGAHDGEGSAAAGAHDGEGSAAGAHAGEAGAAGTRGPGSASRGRGDAPATTARGQGDGAASRSVEGSQRVFLVRGADASLVSAAGASLVARIVGTEDASLVVEHLEGPELDAGQVLAACQTLPFLATQRVVVVRDAGSLPADVGEALSRYMAAPTPTTVLVLLAAGGRVPAALVKAVRTLGAVVETDPPTGRARQDWILERLADAPVRLRRDAVAALAAHLGEDLRRLDGILAALAAAHGPQATVGAAELEPFLGEAGDLPPWALTDAIDAGDEPRALATLRRMLVAGQRAPLAIMASLHRHFAGALALDGAEVSSPAEAAAALGVSSTFVAGKALALRRRLGSDGLADAFGLLAEADLDLRGRSGLPGEVVLEILVGRLARANRARSRRTGTKRASA